MPYLYYCCIDFDEIWWKDAEDQIFSRYRVQQRALSSKKKFCDFLWKFWPKHPLPGYPKNFLRDGTTRVLFSIKNCTDLDRYQKFCQQSRGSLQLCQLQRRLWRNNQPLALPVKTETDSFQSLYHREVISIASDVAKKKSDHKLSR